MASAESAESGARAEARAQSTEQRGFMLNLFVDGTCLSARAGWNRPVVAEDLRVQRCGLQDEHSLWDGGEQL